MKRGTYVMTMLLVFLGAGLGGVARYAIGGWVQDATGAAFPWGTLAVNVSGSVALGFLYVVLEGMAVRPEWRALWTIGVCGGYTTFSAFSYETVRMLQDGEWHRASLYALASVTLALLGLVAGLRGAELIFWRE